MNADEVLALYGDLAAADVPVWIDGGWCVDALLGEQTREHSDLDIAVAREHAQRLEELFACWGYARQPRPEDTEGNYVLAAGSGSLVDVHVFEFDDQGHNTYGIAYPQDSLTGTGVIAGHEVRCVAAEWMFRFKTAYPPEDKDLHDVGALSERYGFEVPATHRRAAPRC
ncbi:lincosamide nucleotidyltransferase A/C/D/E [Nonomuraea maritima]|uniref:Lincosamide nucleotidyltransferase A/C/D/E n=1 Tax=Nonomuraea maritima TaxID=683260 RepID=A0A1G9BP37_9ACTN|nr:aminoglycoside nucleotidyltransferase [Nonomuraea maritima]SDK40904.1 lincosamide nucleotidyltransferase A/C/D/E [Nonomuraea maritima]